MKIFQIHSLRTGERITALALLIMLSLLTIIIPAGAWSNGGYSTDLNNPVPGTHDLILEMAINMLPSEMKDKINLPAAYYGSEIPDCRGNAYCLRDVVKHHVYFKADGTLQDDAGAIRAQEEYDLAESALKSGDIYNFSLHLGAMSHYISDVAVFGHTMGVDTDWGREIHHSGYENYVENHLDSFKNASFDGAYNEISAYNATLNLAKETTFNSTYPNVWMDKNYNWTNPDYISRTEYLINYDTNLVADVIHKLLIVDLSPPQIGEEKQITTDPANQRSPAISGNRIVWKDKRNGNQDIYMYDLSTSTEKQITTNSSDQLYPVISGDHIVWEDKRNGNSEIYMYNLSTSTEKRITTNSTHQWYPDISGGRIVWQDKRNGNWDIYMYDLSTSAEKQITTYPTNQRTPAISGDRIVWQDKRNGNWDIYMYDLSTSTEKQITTDSAYQTLPSISGNRIVWQDKRNGNWDIYMYDFSTGTEKQVTTNTTDQTSPFIFENNIVWKDKRNGNLDIYLYDLSTNTEKQITSDSANQRNPAISGNHIVWQDYRNGNWDIYMYDLSIKPLQARTSNGAW
jgi:TolB protein